MSEFEKASQKISASLDCAIAFTAKKNPIFAWSNQYKGAKIKITGVLAEQTGM